MNESMKIYGGFIKCQRVGYTPSISSYAVTARNEQEAIGYAIKMGREILPISQGYDNHTASMVEVSQEMIDDVIASQSLDREVKK